MSKPKVLAIIPAKNEENYLGLSAESIITDIVRWNIQDAIRLIIVDDGSVDNTYRVAKKYEDKYRFVHVIRNPHTYEYDSSLGLARAIRLGIMFAENKLCWDWNILMQLDADTVIEPGYLPLVLGSMLPLDKSRIGIAGGVSINERTSKHHVRNTGWLVRKEVWSSCHRYTLLPSPDTMLQLCALKEKWKIVIVRNAGMYILRKTRHNPWKTGFTDGLTKVPAYHVIARSARVFLDNKTPRTVIQYLVSYIQGLNYELDIKKELSKERRKLVFMRYSELLNKLF